MQPIRIMEETSNKKTALIAGATGLTGGHLLDLLLNDDTYSRVTVLVRRKMERIHPKLQQVVTDYSNLNELGDALKTDDVFCCLGTTIKKAGSQEAFYKVDHEYPLAVAKKCLELGAKQYLLISAMGADKNSMIFYNRVKGEVERDIGALDYAAVHIMRPSLLLGDREETRLGETLGEVALKAVSFLMVGKLRNYRAIKAADVARAMQYFAHKDTIGVYIHESAALQDAADKQTKANG